LVNTNAAFGGSEDDMIKGWIDKKTFIDDCPNPTTIITKMKFEDDDVCLEEIPEDAIRFNGVVMEHSNENNELVVFAHNPRLLKSLAGKRVSVIITIED
jgi:hypothetical protein